ncbi:SapC family protein [Sulfurihydrogenibium subterraneum]|uniref:SapC family protein n=1 Tax=Sulfurihydrogenibium subterraneum TaxID=171121 RepID=UPI00048C5D3F|nr:SapC family protein [Sulfurihydrogenibium subterraneum]
MAKLFEKTELLNIDKHKNLKWECLKSDCSLSCCFLPKRSAITLAEMPILSKYFPISFVLIKNKDENKEPFKSINIFFKLEEDEGRCTYLELEKGCVLGNEKPLACKQYPFSLVLNDRGQKIINVDFSCPGFSFEKGEPIFGEDSQINQYFQKDFLIPADIFFERMRETQEFVNTMFNYNLVSPAEYHYRGITVKLNAIDESKLYDLPKETLKDFQLRGYFRYIYLHLYSIDNYKKLIDKFLEEKSKVNTVG